MSDPGRLDETGTLIFRRRLPGPIERVWAFLTEADKRARWLAGGEMELWAGGRVELRFLHAELTPHLEAIPEQHAELVDGHVMTGRITRIEPPHLLAFTWGENGDSPSEVCFELGTDGDEVSLLLTHRRLADTDATRVSVAAGWHTHLDILADRLAGRTPQPFWSTHTHYEAEYTQRLTWTEESPP
ncbi:SRPBCC family protein [Algiphilus sp.]|uniref:SRPBCC family protein n=1 Tax=Algiphilus sp. TaxID=1872431 RepID=UPI0025BA2888|nr:SRPBCC family protein [Algiphilus sp.]MCK5770715.1 SRPBCC family protein [Algiphilus sp.]